MDDLPKHYTVPRKRTSNISSGVSTRQSRSDQQYQRGDTMLKIGVITIVLMSFLHAGWFGDLFDSTPTPPISIPIDLSKAGSVVEAEISIKEKKGYIFALHFSYIGHKKDGGIDTDKLHMILGDASYDTNTGVKIPSGIPIQIKLSIYKINDNNSQTMIIDDDYITRGYDGSNSTYMSRYINIIPLEKGKYSIRIQTKENILVLQDRKTLFAVSKFWKK